MLTGKVSSKRFGSCSEPLWQDSRKPLTRWYSTSLGQAITQRLQVELGDRLSDVFGYQALQVGNLVPGMRLLEGAGIQRHLILDAPGGAADIHADVLSLPVASGSMKAVAFFHTLDFCGNPHQALREANRVLTDDGQLIIVGFNPYSTFGARHMATAWRSREPWNGRFYARHRVTDWLSVLDYRVLDSTALFMRPPINSERFMRRCAKLEVLDRWFGALGGVYIMRARKQTLPMSMIRHWSAPRRRVRLASSSFARTGEKPGSRPRATVARIDSRK